MNIEEQMNFLTDCDPTGGFPYEDSWQWFENVTFSDCPPWRRISSLFGSQNGLFIGWASLIFVIPIIVALVLCWVKEWIRLQFKNKLVTRRQIICWYLIVLVLNLVFSVSVIFPKLKDGIDILVVFLMFLLDDINETESGDESNQRKDDQPKTGRVKRNTKDDDDRGKILFKDLSEWESGDELAPQVANRAVRGGADVPLIRQQANEESKHLGGDMEHTHLVKGFDYSLLHKVRAEITKTRHDDPVDEDEELEAALAARAAKPDKQREEEEKKAPESLLARNLQRILFKNEIPHRNELFGKGRMAYVVELDDEASDVPTTLLRSLHDCPVTDSNATVNANNMLISKLTQVLSYLRTDMKKGKGRQAREDFVTEEDRSKAAGASIYDDAGDYVPRREKDEKKDREADKKEKRDYFGDGGRKDDRRDKRDADRHIDDRGGERKKEDTRSREEKERDRRRPDDKEREVLRKRFEEQKRLDEKLAKRKRDTEGYDECYPGEPASKKGRWAWGDDDMKKFSKTSRNTEVKAAYQFGVKKGDGRKSGKHQDKKLDAELDKINKIMEKRKGEGTEAPKVRY